MSQTSIFPYFALLKSIIYYIYKRTPKSIVLRENDRKFSEIGHLSYFANSFKHIMYLQKTRNHKNKMGGEVQ